MVWRCACRAEWPEDGSGTVLNASGGVNNHLKAARAQNEGDLHGVKLVDAKTGEVLIDGANRFALRRLFNPEQAAEDERKRREAAAAARAAKSGARPQESAPAEEGGGRRGQAPAGRQARVLIRDLDLTDNVELLFRLDRQFFPRAFDPVGDTDPKVRADDMTQWLEDMAIIAHSLHPKLRVVYKALHDKMRAFSQEAV